MHLQEIEIKIKTCIRCPLYRHRRNPLAGHFPAGGTDILFILDGPRKLDDEYGQVFVGRTGKLFNKIVSSILELSRKDYSITYCVKCLPLKNDKRVKPNKSSLFWCMEYLYDQIEEIKPKLIVTMGFVPFYTLIYRKDIEFSKKRTFNYSTYLGNLYKIKTLFREDEIYTIPIYSPFSWNKPKKEKVINDFLFIKRCLNDIRDGKDLSNLCENSPDLPTSPRRTKQSRAELFRKKRI